MIKTQDLKLQMDELTKQNDLVLIELEQVKRMLLSGGQSGQDQQGQGQSQSQGNQGQHQSHASSGNGGGASEGSSGGSGNQQNQQTGQFRSSGYSQESQQGNSQGQGNNAGSDPSSAQGGSNQGQGGKQVSDLAYDLLKIKEMVTQLEMKTSQYVNSQSSGSLSEKDAVNLVLTLMNGMVDWASEFVSSKAGSSGQLQ